MFPAKTGKISNVRQRDKTIKKGKIVLKNAKILFYKSYKFCIYKLEFKLTENI